MRLKSVIKYNFSEMKNSALIFYGIMAAVIGLMSFSVIMIYQNNTTDSVGGAEMATVIFLFVVGLNSFKQNYLFLSVNGITRKAQFFSFFSSSLILVSVMATIDTLYSNILTDLIAYRPMFYQTYEGFVANTPKPLIILASFAWSIALYLFAISLGYFITTLYYRMNTILKIIVSVGVPVTFTTLLPIIDSTVTDGKIFGWIGNLFTILSGLKNGNYPYIAVISYLTGAVVLAGLAYLLVRRAPVKE